MGEAETGSLENETSRSRMGIVASVEVARQVGQPGYREWAARRLLLEE